MQKKDEKLLKLETIHLEILLNTMFSTIFKKQIELHKRVISRGSNRPVALFLLAQRSFLSWPLPRDRFLIS